MGNRLNRDTPEWQEWWKSRQGVDISQEKAGTLVQERTPRAAGQIDTEPASRFTKETQEYTNTKTPREHPQLETHPARKETKPYFKETEEPQRETQQARKPFEWGIQRELNESDMDDQEEEEEEDEEEVEEEGPMPQAETMLPEKQSSNDPTAGSYYYVDGPNKQEIERIAIACKPTIDKNTESRIDKAKLGYFQVFPEIMRKPVPNTFFAQLGFPIEWNADTYIENVPSGNYNYQNTVISAEDIQKQWAGTTGHSANGIDDFALVASDITVVCDDEFEPYKADVFCVSMSVPNNPSFDNIGRTWNKILAPMKHHGCLHVVLALFPTMNPMIAGRSLKTAFVASDYGMKMVFLVVLNDHDYRLFMEGWHAIKGTTQVTVAFLNGCGPVTVVKHIRNKISGVSVGIMNPCNVDEVLNKGKRDVGFNEEGSPVTVQNLLALQTTVWLQQNVFPCRSWQDMTRPPKQSMKSQILNHGGTFIIWTNHLEEDKNFVLKVLANADHKSPYDLKPQRDSLIPNTKQFLKGLGIPVEQLQVPGTRFNSTGLRIDEHITYLWGEKFKLKGKQIMGAMNNAMISFVNGQMPYDHTWKREFTNTENEPNNILYYGHFMAVTGPVWIVADDYYEGDIKNRSTYATKTTVLCVSIPGLNLSYGNPVDQSRFLTGRRINDDGVTRIRFIWHHVLWLCSWYNIEYPVLCAIGCGAFGGVNTLDVPEVYANALVDVLTLYGSTFKCVFVSLVKDEHYDTFRDVITRRQKEITMPIALTREHGMLGIALYLAQEGKPAAILNPSDVEAVRQGSMGMYWYHGPAAVEELLAVQTTLLLQHIDMNPELWSDRKRVMAVTSMPQSIANREQNPPTNLQWKVKK